MKKIIAFFLAFFFLGNSFVLAQNSNNWELSISHISVISAKEIDITFSKPIVLSTLRIILENQTTRDVLSVKGYQEGANDSTARVELSSDMSSVTPYKMTVSTATAVTGETIVAWVNAIREFTTPEKFESYIQNETFSAPANTAAVTANESVSTEKKTETESKVETTNTTKASEVQEKNIEKASTLPETGMGMYLIFCILAILFSAIAMKNAKRV